MSDRTNKLLVLLEEDMRIDDCEPLVNAIKSLKGVMDVTPDVLDNTSEYLAYQRARNRIAKKIYEFLKEL